jgi:transcriptional regulator with XRE-family HTH domain
VIVYFLQSFDFYSPLGDYMRSAIDQYIIDKVREIRTKNKKSQESLAYDLGFESSGYIGAIESMNPKRTECYNLKQLNEIALLLNCSPKDFWPESGITEYISPRLKKS